MPYLKGDILFDLIVRAVKATSIVIKPSLTEGEISSIHLDQITSGMLVVIKPFNHTFIN